jgi:DNA replication and repair protein RecF
LQNFRNFQEASFEFSPEINMICGANARGKTSLLEAIYFLIGGRSFRQARLAELIRKGASHFYIEAHFLRHGIEQTLKVTFSSRKKQILYNQNVCPSLASLLGVLKGVVMNPEDISLIKGAPSARREYLDYQIAQVDPLYVHYLTRYYRAMRQRNCLLRSKNVFSLDSWEHEMATAAAYLTKRRARAWRDVAELMKSYYASLSGENIPLNIVYRTQAPYDADSKQIQQYYCQQYQKLRHREMQIGCTLAGPHKDDLEIAFEVGAARDYASEGQQRTCSASLRFGEWACLKSLSEERPLMLIDEAGMGLDRDRHKRLMSQIAEMDQVFLTSTTELPVKSCLINL